MPKHLRFGPDLSQKLYNAIERDNQREEAGMHADDRTTCWPHQSWADDCEDQHNR
ncbi:hypothetical protein [Streptomyces sp. BE133]|uniref:hypothetical protein n=1 Tax=Streptomyces sp. BE133 TaxID=3002523 RepID=UPI002E76D335|nr:hypothetical protein [Streptomyces sp. BE133]MEE1812608.1 hypothetical protein [Streptomyces sp. BE133]